MAKSFKRRQQWLKHAREQYGFANSGIFSASETQCIRSVSYAEKLVNYTLATKNTMSLIQALPHGPLDIVGDIHGEYEALLALLGHLGYGGQGAHADHRTLVFVGDFCDRGPDSPAVLALVQQLVNAGRAVAVLGNHEINLLREDVKDGSGWFFDARASKDHAKYAPYRRPSARERAEIIAFLSSLPIALERNDLRVVHAAWQDDEIGLARTLTLGSVRERYDAWEAESTRLATANQQQQRMAAELENWEHGLENPHHQPPFLHALADFEVGKQMLNPLKVLTSGVEHKGRTPFFAGGKWRFVSRVPWWDSYGDETPVVIGHYWRRVHKVGTAAMGQDDQDLFRDTDPFAWHGKRGNVFCVDFSVGGRWTERKAGLPLGQDFKLAALRWPERSLLFDDGHTKTTHRERSLTQRVR